jgi:hypothetical protein
MVAISVVPSIWAYNPDSRRFVAKPGYSGLIQIKKKRSCAILVRFVGMIWLRYAFLFWR